MPIMFGIELWLDSDKSSASALHAPTLTGGGLPNKYRTDEYSSPLCQELDDI